MTNHVGKERNVRKLHLLRYHWHRAVRYSAMIRSSNSKKRASHILQRHKASIYTGSFLSLMKLYISRKRRANHMFNVIRVHVQRAHIPTTQEADLEPHDPATTSEFASEEALPLDPVGPTSTAFSPALDADPSPLAIENEEAGRSSPPPACRRSQRIQARNPNNAEHEDSEAHGDNGNDPAVHEDNESVSDSGSEYVGNSRRKRGRR